MAIDLTGIDQALNQALTLEDKVKYLIKLFNQYRYTLDLLNLESYIIKLVQYSKETRDETYIAYAFDAMACLAFFKDQYDDTLENCFKSLELAEKHLNYSLASESLEMIGLVYTRMHNYELAERHYLKSIQYNPEYSSSFCNIGYLYFEMDSIEKALFYLDQGINMAEKQKNNHILARAYYYKAVIVLEMGDSDKSIELINQAWRFAEQIVDTYLKVPILLQKVYIYISLNQENRALELLNEAVELASKYSKKIYLASAWSMMAEIYEKLGDFEKAYEYLNLFSDLDYSLNTKEKTDRLSEIQTRYEVSSDNNDMIQLINQTTRLSTVGVVSSGIVHEINQPLTAIKISCDSILFWSRRNFGGIPEVIVDQLNDISESVNYVSKIIEQIRSFWKTNESNLNANSQEYLLNTLLDEKITLIRKKLLSDDVWIDELNCNKRLYSKINEKCFEQILMYLINVCSEIAKNYSSSEEKRIQISLSHELDFNIIRIQFNNEDDLKIEKILSSLEQDEKIKALLLDFKLSKYFINQFNGFITYSDTPFSHFKIALPGKCEDKI
jgi:tetratricopeptide (TPR) repeat protein